MYIYKLTSRYTLTFFKHKIIIKIHFMNYLSQNQMSILIFKMETGFLQIDIFRINAIIVISHEVL